MARRALATRSPVVFMNAPRRRRAGRTIVRYARRAGRAGRKSLPTVGVALGGLVVGYLDGRGTFNDLPEVGGLTHMGMVGLIGWGLTRFTRDPRIRAAGLAALAAAAYDFGREQGQSAEGGTAR